MATDYDKMSEREILKVIELHFNQIYTAAKALQFRAKDPDDDRNVSPIGQLCAEFLVNSSFTLDSFLEIL
jgi:hypothetical protein